MSTPLSTRALLRWLADKATRRTEQDFETLTARTDFLHVASEVLRSGTVQEKTTVLRALQPIATPEAHALARQALRDDEASVRALAARAMAGPHDAQDWQCLLAALDDTEPAVQAAVMDALARLDPAAASTLLLTRFEHASTAEQLSALATAQRLRLPDSPALGRLGRGASSAAVRRAAVALLAQTGESAAPLLIDALTDADAGVQHEALRALARRERVPSQVFHPLLAALTPQVQLEAIRALILRRDASACEPIMRLLGAAVPLVRRQAILATGQLGCASTRASLLELLTRSDDADERASVVTALGMLGGDEAWAALREALTDAAQPVRRAAATAWATNPAAPTDRTALLFERLKADPAPDVRMHIAATLASSDAETGRQALHIALVDPAPQVRRMAVNTLGRSASGDALEVLRAHQPHEKDAGVLQELSLALEQSPAAEPHPRATSPREQPLFDPAQTGQQVTTWLEAPERAPITDRLSFYSSSHLEHLTADDRLHTFQYSVTGGELRLQPEHAPARTTRFILAHEPPGRTSDGEPHRFRLELAQDIISGTGSPRVFYYCVGKPDDEAA